MRRFRRAEKKIFKTEIGLRPFLNRGIREESLDGMTSFRYPFRWRKDLLLTERIQSSTFFDPRGLIRFLLMRFSSVVISHHTNRDNINRNGEVELRKNENV